MAYIKQVIKGRTVKSLDVDASEADLTELMSVMAGAVTLFELDSEGGADTTLPAELNRKRLSCGNRSQKLSCSFNVPHVKSTVHINDFETVVIGAFDAGYETTTKADYCNLLYDKN